MRKILAITGSRAEYGIFYPVFQAIKATPSLELLLLVTGMHLSHEFGYTAQEIERDGFNIDAKVDMLLASDSEAAMAKSIGLGVTGIAQALEKLKPDIVLVLGDRIEPLAAAVAAAYMNIPLAHIHGGDSSRGGVDEYGRHAITKLAHIHFPATPTSAQRIIRMGEDEWRVHLAGSPALDYIFQEEFLTPETIAQKYSLETKSPLLLVVQHPVTTEVTQAASQMRQTMEALVGLKLATILIYPNADAGGRRMIEVIKEYEHYPFIKTFKSLPHRDFLSLMRVAGVMVGNSSSGIIETPSFALPAVNIGIRQEGRERAKNVIDVPHDKRQIVEAVSKALTDQEFLAEVEKRENPYGDGQAGKRIARILSELEISPRLLQKKITY